MSNSVRNRKDKGDRLEEFVIENFKDFDTSTEKASKEFGDVISKLFLTECKNHNTKSLSIDVNHWKKIRQRATALEKIPLYVRRNSEGDTFVVLDFLHFKELMEAFHYAERR